MWPEFTKVQNALAHYSESPSPNVRFSASENLHLTIKFLGDISETTIPHVLSALERISRDFHPPLIQVRGLNGFPNINRPRALYAAISAGSQEIIELGNQLDEALFSIGITKENRQRTPHITIARLGKEPMREGLSSWLQRSNKKEVGRFVPKELVLYDSTPNHKGSVYQILHQYSFVSMGIPS